MYGLVIRALEEMISANHGDAVWQDIKQSAGVDIPLFVRMESYPDEMVYRLVGATCERLNISADDALRAFGEYWVLFTGADGYGELLDEAGGSVFEVLCNLNALHERVGALYPKLVPPTFECTDMSEQSLILHYYSTRDGLSPMMFGLLEGLGKRFGTPVVVRQLTAKTAGDDHDSFAVSYA